MIKQFTLTTIAILCLYACSPTASNHLTGVTHNEETNTTNYFLTGFGQVALPGKWEKTNYNTVSHQQFFTNQDGLTLAIAITKTNQYPFNQNGKLNGHPFLQAYYEWDTNYFLSNAPELNAEILESNKAEKYIFYRIHGIVNGTKLDNYFLITEAKDNMQNFMFSNTKHWDASEIKRFLLALKNE